MSPVTWRPATRRYVVGMVSVSAAAAVASLFGGYWAWTMAFVATMPTSLLLFVPVFVVMVVAWGSGGSWLTDVIWFVVCVVAVLGNAWLFEAVEDWRAADGDPATRVRRFARSLRRPL